MLAEVRKCAEANDIKGLRYMFVDCLDVDPTFAKYEEDYNYCKNIPGFFDAHIDLNGMVSDSGIWDTSYWNQLKIDLMKNFSKERFEHMIQVAKVVYAEKIERLVNERQSLKDTRVEAKKTSVLTSQSGNVQLSQDDAVAKKTTGENISTVDSGRTRKISDDELQKRRIAEKRQALDEENRRIEAKQAAQRARIEAAKKEMVNRSNMQTGNTAPKKVLGMVLGIIIVIVVVAFIIMKVMQ